MQIFLIKTRYSFIKRHGGLGCYEWNNSSCYIFDFIQLNASKRRESSRYKEKMKRKKKERKCVEATMEKKLDSNILERQGSELYLSASPQLYCCIKCRSWFIFITHNNYDA